MIKYLENQDLEKLLNEYNLINKDNNLTLINIFFNVVTMNYILIYITEDYE